MREALLYERIENSKVRCKLCNHFCIIPAGHKGICNVRMNIEGCLYSLNSDILVAASIDPVEKKPLFHLAPSSTSYSIACPGCNFHCLFCQNWDIAQELPKRILSGTNHSDYSKYKPDPSAIVASAIESGCKSISYTYTEPTVYFELVHETSRIAAANGLRNILVTNGFMSQYALEAISPYIDAANVDLKAFDDEFYKNICGAKLKPVLDNIKQMKKSGIWIEITTLLIPGLNDGPDKLKELANFIAYEIGKETPWHVSRFHPQHKMLDKAPTSISQLKNARRIGMEAGLKYVYTGNIPGDDGENSFCSSCGSEVVHRHGYRIINLKLKQGRCVDCGAEFDGVDIP